MDSIHVRAGQKNLFLAAFRTTGGFNRKIFGYEKLTFSKSNEKETRETAMAPF